MNEVNELEALKEAYEWELTLKEATIRQLETVCLQLMSQEELERRITAICLGE